MTLPNPRLRARWALARAAIWLDAARQFMREEYPIGTRVDWCLSPGVWVSAVVEGYDDQPGEARMLICTAYNERHRASPREVEFAAAPGRRGRRNSASRRH